MHPLYTADASKINRELLDAFLALRLAENRTLEYKRRGGDTTLEAIAGMANTDGGIVLVGVDEDSSEPECPGELVGVSFKERERLVNQIAGTFEPVWTPEIVPVPLHGDKAILVVRIDRQLVPPVTAFKGYLPIRLEARTAKADLRMMAGMLAQADSWTGTQQIHLRNSPRDRYSLIRDDEAGPSVVVRAFISLPLRVGTLRRLDSRTQQSLRSLIVKLRPAVYLNNQLGPRVCPDWLPSRGWTIQRSFSDSRKIRYWTGTSTDFTDDWPHTIPGLRADCLVTLEGEPGLPGRLDLGLDISYWLQDGQKVPWHYVAESAFQVTESLVGELYPGVANFIGGKGYRVTPPVELYIEPGTKPAAKRPFSESPSYARCTLDRFVDFEELGTRPTGRTPYAGREFLSSELISDGRINEAVSHALDLMVLDWGHAPSSR